MRKFLENNPLLTAEQETAFDLSGTRRIGNNNFALKVSGTARMEGLNAALKLIAEDESRPKDLTPERKEYLNRVAQLAN